MRLKLPLLRTRYIRPAQAPILRYGVAVLSIILALIPAFLLHDVFESRLVVFGVAVMVSAWYGGWKPGLAATSFALTVSAYYSLAGEHTPEDYRKAVGYFDQAIRLDPEYALAYAERSEAWTLIGDILGEGKTAWPKARSDAEKAVAIAPALAEAHAALGWVRFFTEWKFAEGLGELKRAKELSPANPTANDLLARMIVYLGKLDEAEEQARQAVELEPLASAPHNNLARVLWYEGKLDEADAVARKSAELQPSSASSRRWQVLVAIRHNDAETALREAQLEPDESYRRFLLPLAQYARGDRKAADAALADLIANNRGLDYQIAQVYAVRGEKEKAFEWLQIAFDNHDTGMLALLVDPLLNSLRGDPRYKTLLAKMAFPATS